MWTVVIILVLGVAFGWKRGGKSEKYRRWVPMLGWGIVGLIAGFFISACVTLALEPFLSIQMEQNSRSRKLLVENQISHEGRTASFFLIQSDDGFFYKLKDSKKKDFTRLKLDEKITVLEDAKSLPAIEIFGLYYKNSWARAFLLEPEDMVYNFVIPQGGKITLN